MFQKLLLNPGGSALIFTDACLFIELVAAVPGLVLNIKFFECCKQITPQYQNFLLSRTTRYYSLMAELGEAYVQQWIAKR